jgi:hypothetical protein
LLHGAHIHNLLPNHVRRPGPTRSEHGTAAP